MKTPLAVAAASLVALGAAACGEDKKGTFSEDYKPLNAKLLTLGNDVKDRSTAWASGKTNVALVAAQLEEFGSRLSSLRTDIAELDPPPDLKDESKALTESLGKAEEGLSDIVKALDDEDADAAAVRRAGGNLSGDVQKANAAQNKLARATGAEVGN